MTRKDYIALAADLAVTWRNLETDEQRRAVSEAVDDMMRALERENPRFDRDRFVAAARGEQ